MKGRQKTMMARQYKTLHRKRKEMPASERGTVQRIMYKNRKNDYRRYSRYG